MVTEVMEYKCPCCDAPLIFGEEAQQMKCEYCDTHFDIETVREYNAPLVQKGDEGVHWEEQVSNTWTEEEAGHLQTYSCASCAGELVTTETTAATFCPYCGNPTILPGRLSGNLKPDCIIPFKNTKEDAKTAFLNLCKKKPLLPRYFTRQQQVERITGIYVPFWLYDCRADFSGTYKATRMHHWTDGNYNYTKTDHFQLRRCADAQFAKIPMDGSRKMDDAIMESIEPYDYSGITEFDTAYLSGFLAEKYDVESREGEPRIRERVDASMNAMVSQSMMGYATTIPVQRSLNISESAAKYALLPVWILTTRYQDRVYTFAMNGQTGKMTGSFPICPKRTAMWFAGIFAGVTALVSLVQLLFM